jgi:predicted ester cyclase
MSATDNLAVVHNWASLVNSGDIDAAVGCLADDFAGYFTGMAEPVQGPEGFKQMYITIEEELAVGDRVGVQVSWTATHQGPFLGITPTGKTITVAGTGIFRVADGKIAEEWMQEDFLGIYQQLTQG